VIGTKILEKNPSFGPYLPVVLHHHERLDGSGYPSGLRGSEIPMDAQIVAVADVISALTTDRPYRKSLKPVEALEYIYPQRGTRLNADAIDAARSYIEETEGQLSPSVFTMQEVTLPQFLRHFHS
jgi:HD-GYP domain-containing protein (c-di-GMP phosphodiesterase class II)